MVMVQNFEINSGKSVLVEMTYRSGALLE